MANGSAEDHTHTHTHLRAVRRSVASRDAVISHPDHDTTTVSIRRGCQLDRYVTYVVDHWDQHQEVSATTSVTGMQYDTPGLREHVERELRDRIHLGAASKNLLLVSDVSVRWWHLPSLRDLGWAEPQWQPDFPEVQPGPVQPHDLLLGRSTAIAIPSPRSREQAIA